MSFLEVMHTYFRGEKFEAFMFILPLGVVLVVCGLAALKFERSGFAWGAVVPAIAFGLVLIGTGIGVGARTAGQVTAIKEAFQASPAAMATEELPRMQKVNANFAATFVIFGVMIAAGLILTYALRIEWLRGLGIGLILVAALGLVVDGFASRRAAPYTLALEAIAQQGPDGDGG